MKISFVIPAYNEERYISDCLNSIFELDGLDDFEIIVADNQSTDRTREVVRRFPEVRVVEAEKRGPAAARNAGAKSASGDYLAFIDADCQVPRDWYVKLKKILWAEKWDAVLGTYRYLGAESGFRKLIYSFIPDLIFWFFCLIGIELLGIGGPASGGNTIVKRSSFQAIGGFNEGLIFFGEDIELVKRLVKKFHVRFFPGLWVYSSDRRLKKEGILRIWGTYFINTWWTILRNRPLITKFHIIR